MFSRKISLYFALIGIAATVVLVARGRQTPTKPPPLAEPSRSPYPVSVAATGIVEARRENVKIAAPKAALVKSVAVKVGSVVKTGDTLLQLDDREAAAQVSTSQAQLDAASAGLAAERVNLADLTDQLERVSKLEKEKVATEDERLRKMYAVNGSQARLQKLAADVKSAEAQLRFSAVSLDLLTVRAPRDGTILQVNIREGEWAGLTPADPLMVLGENLHQMQIRADVDEQNAPLVIPDQPAVAYLKGTASDPLPLRFVRIEPYIIPKKSLTGDNAERVDTRVLQIIYELDRPAIPLYVGQQMDVFIQRPGNAEKPVASVQ
jgi:multidrug efflux pump subunit AcrA (membrane-fusion protein)